MARFSLVRFFLLLALVFDASLLRYTMAEDASPVASQETEATEEAAYEAGTESEEPVETEDPVEAVVEDPVEEVSQPETTESSNSPMETIKEKASSALSGLKEKVDSLVEKVKSVDKATLKKVAVGAVGVWGVSVAVGWLANKGSTAGATATPEKKRR